MSAEELRWATGERIEVGDVWCVSPGGNDVDDGRRFQVVEVYPAIRRIRAVTIVGSTYTPVGHEYPRIAVLSRYRFIRRGDGDPNIGWIGVA